MSKTKPYDPLTYIPGPDILRRQLEETELLASRLRILLRVAEEIAGAGADAAADRPEKEAVA
jgi:hypothetical protein